MFVLDTFGLQILYHILLSEAIPALTNRYRLHLLHPTL